MVRSELIHDRVRVIALDLPGYGIDVNVTVVDCGEGKVLVVDTGIPSFANSFSSHDPGTSVTVVYTHADFDHCLGTHGIFPRGRMVLAHREAVPRLRMVRDVELPSLIAAHPAVYQGTTVVMPDLTFGDQVDLFPAAEMSARLIHVPGHTPDSIMVFLEEYRILIAGDAAEDPLPALWNPENPVEKEAYHGMIRRWADTLEYFAQEAKIVIPGHGRPQGPELLEDNARYLRTLDLDSVPGYRLERLSPGAAEFYAESHSLNCAAVAFHASQDHESVR